MLRLVLPTPAHQEQIWAYREEFLKYGDTLAGTASLDRAESFEEWFAAWRDNGSEETVRAGLVPATTFLAMDGERLVGMIDIRHRLNGYLLNFGGHIGYSVRREERQKGYAAGMLALALEECRRLGLERVLVTCDKDNLASARTILRNGGVLENEVEEDGETVQRYWIKL